MKTLDLDVKKPGKGDLPFPPITQISVNMISNGNLIGHQCVCVAELESEARRLKKQIDDAVRKGKRVYAQQRKDLAERRSQKQS